MRIRYLLFIFIFVVSLVVLSTSSVSAAQYSLYSNLSQNDSIVNNLIGIYHNSEGYDPYNEYCCVRVGQTDYYLFYGKSLNGDYKYIRYYAYGSGMGTQYNYDVGEGSNLQLNTNGYVGVGNIAGFIQSDKASQFGFGYVITVLLILLAILVIFKTFKKVYRPRSDRGYTL